MTTGDMRLGDLQRVALMKSDDSGVTWYAVQNPVGAGGGSTQPYTEGAVDATIDGTPVMWEDTGDTLRVASAAKPLPVAVISGGGGGTQYVDGVTQASPTGNVMEWLDASNVIRAVSATKPLPVAQQGSVAVTGTFWQATQPVSGTVTANAGSGPFPVSDNAGSLTVDAPVATPVFVRLSDGTSAIATLPVSLASVPSHQVTNAGTFAVQADTEMPAAAALADATANPSTTSVGIFQHFFNGTTWDRARGDTTNGLDVDVTRVSGTVTVNQSQIAGTATSVNSGNKDAGTQRVVIATDQVQLTNALKVDGSAVTQPVSGTVTVSPAKGSSCTPTQVACSTTSATLKASNASRKGLVIYNDAAVALYVKFGATASSTSFTVKLPAGTVYEISGPEIYTGIVDGVLASGTGNAYASEW